MDRKTLYGVVCASICPMNEDGSVDYASVRTLTRHLVDHGIHCLYPNGTNGESLSLTEDERRQIARIIAEENAGKAVLYIQCGAATVEESYRHVRFSSEIGADGAGLMTPVFFAMDDSAMLKYYEDILNEITDFPIYAYNIPTRSGNDLKPAVLGTLMRKYENMIGVKYSFPDVTRLQQYITCCPGRHVSVLVGSDAIATGCFVSGGDGWVSGPSAVWPERHAALYDALKAGEMEKAREIQYSIIDTARRMSDIPEIPAIKYMLKKMGVIQCDVCRMPLRPLTEAEKARLDELIG